MTEDMEGVRSRLAKLLAEDEQTRLARYQANYALADEIWHKIRILKNNTAGNNHNLDMAESHMLEFCEKLSEIVPRMTKYIEQGDKNEQETGSREFAVSANAPWNKVQKQSSGSSE